ncbi:MAG: hypothetical protein M3417_00350 [Actinomycetota bacterium]|nr:hypothetical protein [Actinomycetota bacterium]
MELQQQSHQGAAPLHAREHVGAVALEPARRLVAGQAVLAVALQQHERVVNGQVMHPYSANADRRAIRTGQGAWLATQREVLPHVADALGRHDGERDVGS